MKALFGLCANALSPDDGKVVSMDHGCGAHSETAVELHARLDLGRDGRRGRGARAGLDRAVAGRRDPGRARQLSSFALAELRAAVLDAWTASPARFREDANAEDDLALGGYRDRLVVELAQNASDAGGPSLSLAFDGSVLSAANTGSPLDADGVAALASLRASSKRSGGTVGRFGVGFAAVAAVADEVVVASTTGAVRFSRALTLAAVQDIPALAKELALARGRVPLLRLPFECDEAPRKGFDTEVRITVRPESADAVRAMLAEVDPTLLLVLPGLSSLEVDGRSLSSTSRRTGRRPRRRRLAGGSRVRGPGPGFAEGPAGRGARPRHLAGDLGGAAGAVARRGSPGLPRADRHRRPVVAAGRPGRVAAARPRPPPDPAGTADRRRARARRRSAGRAGGRTPGGARAAGADAAAARCRRDRRPARIGGAAGVPRRPRGSGRHRAGGRQPRSGRAAHRPASRPAAARVERQPVVRAACGRSGSSGSPWVG